MQLAFFSSHINKSLQWLWYQKELDNHLPNAIHIIINTELEEPFLAHDLRANGLTVYVLNHRRSLDHIKNIIKAVGILKKHKIEIVHTTLPFGNLIGQTAAYICGIDKRVTTCENASWAHDFKNKKQEFVDKFTFRLAKKVIAVADTAREYLEKNWNIKQDKLTTIYHGLEESEYENISDSRVERMRRIANIPQGQFVIGMIARLEFWKGHQYAIEAMKFLKEKGYPVKLYIFGGKGPDYNKIHQQIEALGLSEDVFYKGFMDDPVALFKLFDIHLHVPVNRYVENCGINIIEGMISAKAQALTLSGYAAQSAIHMHNAYVVDYCSSIQISEAVMYLFDNPEKAQEFGKNARLDALSQYGNKIKVKKHLELYSAL